MQGGVVIAGLHPLEAIAAVLGTSDRRRDLRGARLDLAAMGSNDRDPKLASRAANAEVDAFPFGAAQFRKIRVPVCHGFAPKQAASVNQNPFVIGCNSTSTV